MIHNEHLRKADESYEIRHDNNGNAIHVYIKDGQATAFPTLEGLVSWVYLGTPSEHFCVSESELSRLYESEEYSYYKLKKSLS